MVFLGLAMTSFFLSPIRSHAEHFEGDEEHASSENLFNMNDPSYQYGNTNYYPGSSDTDPDYAYCVFTVSTDITYHLVSYNFEDLYYFNSNRNDYDFVSDIEGTSYITNNLAYDDYLWKSDGCCFNIPSSAVNNSKTVKLCLTCHGYAMPESYEDVFFLTELKIIDATAPSITVSANYIVNVDYMQSQSQILSHVIVVDENDPNPQLIVRSTNYSASNRVCGTYQMTIYALDIYGNQTPDYTFNIIVADSTQPSNSGFKTISQPNNVQLSENDILDKFTVSDNYSDTENISKTIIKNDYASHWQTPGKYEIICRATDEAGNSTDTSSFIQVVDKVNPTIVGATRTQGNNAQLTREELLALFTATDDYSAAAKITKSILTDSYTSSWKRPGTYQVTCRATDEAGNHADATATIVVEDKTAPTLGVSNVDRNYNDKITDLRSLFTYSDDVSEVDRIIFEIVTDNYTVNYNVKGNYTVRARVTDEAGNISEASAVVRVIDTIKPVITVPTEITVGNSTSVSTDSLKAKIVVEDGYDGTITNFLVIDKENYRDNYQKIGRYKFEINAKDESGNTQTAFFTVIVTDTTSPKVYYDRYYICISESEVLTDEMIKSFAAQALGVDVASVLSVEGTYDVESTGEYSITLYMMDGTVQPFTISVGELEPKEPARWTFKGFFSNNMDNWTQFDQLAAWSICAWLAWIAIGIGSLIAAVVVFVIGRKIYRTLKK